MATPQIAPILRLPTEILEGICIQIERDSHRDLTRFSVACKAIRIAAERVVFAKVELLTKFNTRASGAHHYARVAQNRPRLPSRSFQAVFLSPAPRVLEFTSFWNTSAFGPSAASWMAAAFGRILTKPTNLRKLELDGTVEFAQHLECFLAGLDNTHFHGIKEITISLEFDFLIKLMPNVVRLSNMPREGFGRAVRDYDHVTIQRFFDLCGTLKKLTHLDLSIADFHEVLGLSIPALTIQSMKICEERLRCPRTWYNLPEGRVPMGFLLDLALPQANLIRLEIPAERWIAMGWLDLEGTWVDRDEYADELVAAIVAVKCASVQHIHVGHVDHHETARATVLKNVTWGPYADVLEPFLIHAVHEGPEGDPAWIEEPEEGLKIIYVNEDCEAIHEYE
ncbi:hypothetical protein HDK90DRAFT_529475 [Phyllosticta capitalensis]|uniref:F-box domain-containing protein n=1 Tax=Phyllosticta capitalensis TaxID=121624 RepID=A0ABR1Y8W2_9PEZI